MMNMEYPIGRCVMDYGAAANGQTDDTVAFQSALEDAAKTGDAVVVPSGIYAVGELHIPPHVTLCGSDSSSLTENGGSVLRLCDENAVCLLDLTGADGAMITGLTLLGENAGECVHGIFAENDSLPETSDGFTVADCKCAGFSGDGAHLVNVHTASVHHCLFSENENGFSFDGTALHFIDNRCAENRANGFVSDEITHADVTGCSFDNNGKTGVCVTAARGLELNGNAYLSNCLEGLVLAAVPEKMHDGIAVTGSAFTGNGLSKTDSPTCQSRIAYIAGLSFVGNTFGCLDDKRTEVSLYLHHAERGAVLANNFINGAVYGYGMRTHDLKHDLKIENNLG